MDVPTLFLRETTIRWRQEYLPRIDTAVDGLSGDEIWWRPHDDTTSIGILLRHLEGNVRQWILSGIAGEPDLRERASEFASDARPDRAALVGALRTTVGSACRFLDTMPEQRLSEILCIQGFRITVIGAVYHVLEHFGWHTGQITWIAKLQRGAGHGIRFHDDDSLDSAHNE